MMQLVAKILASLAVVSAAVLFAAAVDLAGLGLGDTLGILAAIPLLLFVVGSLAHIFLSGGGAAAVASDAGDDITAKIEDVRTKLGTRISNLQGAVDGLSGQDRDTLLAENQQLKEQLEAIEQAERDKVMAEMDSLKERNELLEEKIKQWAIQSVDEAMAPKAAAEQPQQPAAA
ncbi:MAG: hypothetical protein OXR62_13110 [Ahrensia sp.]|nr:hypothetical protein [Ahrensia sp.]